MRLRTGKGRFSMNFVDMKNPLKSLKNHFPLSVTLTTRILFLTRLCMALCLFKLTEGKIVLRNKVESVLKAEF